MASKQWVYYFGEGGGAEAKGLLGGKGANLAEMTKIGLPVPPGFTITTEACNATVAAKKWPAGLADQVAEKLKKLEAAMKMGFGDAKNPLLVSVRSGAKISMPGMMDTVLNLGLNDKVVVGLAALSGNPRFAYDSYRRFIQMFGDVVMGVEHHKFEEILDAVKKENGAAVDTDLTTDNLKEVVKRYFVLYKQVTGKDFPQDPMEQLHASIDAVFSSWDNDRAIAYRNMNGIPHDLGTAVNVQSMVFGNMGDDSATGVAFTRNPSTGEAKRYGEYLVNAQGEDVVAGIRTPLDIHDMVGTSFEQNHTELMEVFATLEKHYKDMQDVEFTIMQKKLYLLQTRNGKRTAAAALKIAIDMVGEGFIDKEEAVMRVTPTQLDQLLHKQLDPKAKKTATKIGKGLPASPGAAVGAVVFTAADAVEQAAAKKVILVRLETSPEDIQGMDAAEGILTARGGMTSHAAVVARGMNKCCVAGCSELDVKEREKVVEVGGKAYKEGDIITLDGATGEIFLGALPVVDPEMTEDFETILKWSDAFRRLGIRTNADVPADAKIARDFGAEGIGLTRTEHMFFAAERINAVREMILADDEAGRRTALDKLLPFQREDFYGLFKEMAGLPVIVRLIDPPLHEFLPTKDKDIDIVAEQLKVSSDRLRTMISSMHEFNPMLGFRGCRLGVVYPEINEMQVRAIFQAAVQAKKEGFDPKPEIEVPLVGHLAEYLAIKEVIMRVAKETGAEGTIAFKVGTMVEVPRAALTADEFAPHVDFMSFGTNDLTQMTCGFSRDDAGKFLGPYVEKGIYKTSPFESLDQEGVGILMRICVEKARPVNPKVDIGICGEHGGDPDSVDFCNRIGLDNVSCSPWRVPIARLAAAQSQIILKRK